MGEVLDYPAAKINRVRECHIHLLVDAIFKDLIIQGCPRWQVLEVFLQHALLKVLREYGPEQGLKLSNVTMEQAFNNCLEIYGKDGGRWWLKGELNPMHEV